MSGHTEATTDTYLRLRLLGAFRLDVGGIPMALPGSAQRLTALLAVRGPAGRSRLAGTLWPNATEAHALGCLRSAIWRVNQAAPGLVTVTSGALDLAPGAEIDVRRLLEASHAVLAGTGPLHRDGAPREAELLPGWDDEWVLLERERLWQLHVHMAEAQAELLLAQAAYGLALEWALVALRADPLRESAHRTVIRIHLAEGNLTQARASTQRCVDLFHAELGLPPSSRVTALVEGPAVAVTTR